MHELTDRQYWNAVHERDDRAPTRPAEDARERVPSTTRARRWVRALLGNRIINRMQSYADYTLWQGIYARHMPRSAAAAVLEVGSAPGLHLLELRDRFGITPYGIDYSESGVAIQRRVFAAHGIDPDHVICADFFSDEIRQRYGGRFDVVLSRGFIEHFADPREAIARHVALLKPGGRLFVSIPNLRGVNYGLAWLLNRPVLAMHNTGIMTRERFAALFAAERLSPLYSGYYGTFDFTLFFAPPTSPLRHLVRAGWRAQMVLNLLFRTLFGDRGADGRFSSPYLIYVGVKVD